MIDGYGRGELGTTTLGLVVRAHGPNEEVVGSIPRASMVHITLGHSTAVRHFLPSLIEYL